MRPMRIFISSTVSTLALSVSRELSLVRTNWIPHMNAHDAQMRVMSHGVSVCRARVGIADYDARLRRAKKLQTKT